MNRIRYNSVVLAVLFLTACEYTLGAPALLRDIPVWETKPPARPAHDVWIEGEDGSVQTGWSVVGEASCYGGKKLVLHTGESGEFTAEYRFTLREAGSYLVSVAGQPVGTPWTSPIWYSVDGGTWLHVTSVPSSKVLWGVANAIRWTHLTLADLAAGEHVLRIKVNEPRVGPDPSRVYMIDAISLLRDPIQRLNICPSPVTGQPGNVFAEPQAVTFERQTPTPNLRMDWRVVDWQDREIATGTWSGDQQKLTLGELPRGYYRLKLKRSDTADWQRIVPFARVVSPDSRKPNPESPYALDSVQSWIEYNSLTPTNVSTVLADLTQLLGVSMVRDRFTWGGNNPKPGEFHWGTYQDTAKLLHDRGVKVCTVFHDAPEWATKGDPKMFIDDLVALYRFTRRAAGDLKGLIDAWECGNEEDAGQLAAWDFAAAQKAAYLGLKAGNPNANVLIGSTCLHPVPRFMDVVMENGAGDYFDTHNFHVYQPPVEQYDLIAGEERKLLVRHGIGHKPMWVTENGQAHEGSGLAEPIIPGSDMREHNDQQERDQAEFIVKSQVSMHAAGVARDFFFVFKPYNEQRGGKVWGLLRWDYTAKPAYVALANLTYQLGNARYLGKKSWSSRVRGFVFQQPDGTRTLVCWSADGKDTEISLNETKPVEQVDLVGRTTPVHPRNNRITITAGKFPVYINGLSRLTPDASFVPPARASTANSDKDLTIVARIKLGQGFSTFKNTARIIDGEHGQAVLEVFNLSDRQKQGTIESLDRHCVVDGLPRQVTVPAMSRVQLPITVRLAKNTYRLVKLRIAGQFEGQPISPVCVQIMPPHPERDPSLVARLISTADAGRWEVNSSGTMTIAKDEKENAVRFHVTFPPFGDRWVYPEFRLSSPKENLAGAVAVGFELKAESWHGGQGLLMAVMENVRERGLSHYFEYVPTQEWQEVLILFESEAPVSFDPAGIKRLRIGANPAFNDYTYWVRNVKAYYRK